MNQAAEALVSPEAAAEVFNVRPFAATDFAFVRDSWLRSAWGLENRKLKRRKVSARNRIQASRSWFDKVRPYVGELLNSGDLRVLVACCRETPDHIAAWMVIKDGAAIRLYIKQAYRGWGVDALLRGAI
jgi:hypothetical protein